MQLLPSTEWRKIEVYPISFSYVWTITEHQIQDLQVSRKIQVFFSLRWPQIQIQRKQGHQRSGATLGFINYNQKATTAVNSVERQETVNIE